MLSKVRPDQQLEVLLSRPYSFTVDEIARSVGCRASTIYSRRASSTPERRTLIDERLDELHFVVTFVEGREAVDPETIRWWMFSRSPYLRGHPPARLIALGKFDVVCRAVVAAM